MMFARNVPAPGPGSTTAIVSWFLLVVSIFALFTRLGTKWSTRRKLNLDDALAVAAVSCDLGSSIAVHVQAMHGLGYPLDSLSSDTVTIFMKGLYALFLTYIPTLCFAKLSILALLLSITPAPSHQIVAYIIATLIVVGAVVTELAAAFQCHTPRPWLVLGNECFQRADLWRFVGALSIICDLALIVMPLIIIVPIHMKTKKKLLIFISFSTRILDVAASSSQLGFTSAFESPDLSLNIWKWVLLARLTQCISIVTSCIPYLRPLLESLPTGMFLSDELRRRGQDATSYYNESEYRSRSFNVTKTSAAGAMGHAMGNVVTIHSHDFKKKAELSAEGGSPSLAESQGSADEIRSCEAASQNSRSDIWREGKSIIV